MKKLSFGFLMLFCLNCIFALENKKADTYKTHETSDKNAPVVYFTSDVSSQGLMKVYKALNQKISGNVGIKVSFGGPTEQVLDPSLLTDLVRKIGRAHV